MQVCENPTNSKCRVLDKLIALSARQEIPCLTLNPNVHYRVHITPSPTIYPEPRKFNLQHPSLFLRYILIISFYLRLGISSDFPFRYFNQISYVTHARYMFCPSYTPRFNHYNNIYENINIKKNCKSTCFACK